MRFSKKNQEIQLTFNAKHLKPQTIKLYKMTISEIHKAVLQTKTLINLAASLNISVDTVSRFFSINSLLANKPLSWKYLKSLKIHEAELEFGEDYNHPLPIANINIYAFDFYRVIEIIAKSPSLWKASINLGVRYKELKAYLENVFFKDDNGEEKKIDFKELKGLFLSGKFTKDYIRSHFILYDNSAQMKIANKKTVSTENIQTAEFICDKLEAISNGPPLIKSQLFQSQPNNLIVPQLSFAEILSICLESPSFYSAIQKTLTHQAEYFNNAAYVTQQLQQCQVNGSPLTFERLKKMQRDSMRQLTNQIVAETKISKDNFDFFDEESFVTSNMSENTW